MLSLRACARVRACERVSDSPPPPHPPTPHPTPHPHPTHAHPRPLCPRPPPYPVSNAWQLGWLTPAASYTSKSSISAGATKTHALAAQTDSATSGIRISASAFTTSAPALWVGYRVAEGGDASLTAAIYSGRTSVHSSSAADNYDPQTSYWRASLASGESYTEVGGAGRGGAGRVGRRVSCSRR